MAKRDLLPQRISGVLYVLNGMAKIAPQLDVLSRPAGALDQDPEIPAELGPRPKRRGMVLVIATVALFLLYRAAVPREDAAALADPDEN